MSVILQGSIVQLQGDCRVEDAEKLLMLLQAASGRRVDLGDVRILHTAVLQVLLALRPEIIGTADEPFIQKWLMPLLV